MTDKEAAIKFLLQEYEYTPDDELHKGDLELCYLEGIAHRDSQLKGVVEAFRKHQQILQSIIEIGKRDLTNPKYDSYFEGAKEILKETLPDLLVRLLND